MFLSFTAHLPCRTPFHFLVRLAKVSIPGVISIQSTSSHVQGNINDNGWVVKISKESLLHLWYLWLPPARHAFCSFRRWKMCRKEGTGIAFANAEPFIVGQSPCVAASWKILRWIEPKICSGRLGSSSSWVWYSELFLLLSPPPLPFFSQLENFYFIPQGVLHFEKNWKARTGFPLCSKAIPIYLRSRLALP